MTIPPTSFQRDDTTVTLEGETGDVTDVGNLNVAAAESPQGAEYSIAKANAIPAGVSLPQTSTTPATVHAHVSHTDQAAPQAVVTQHPEVATADTPVTQHVVPTVQPKITEQATLENPIDMMAYQKPSGVQYMRALAKAMQAGAKFNQTPSSSMQRYAMPLTHTKQSRQRRGRHDLQQSSGAARHAAVTAGASSRSTPSSSPPPPVAYCTVCGIPSVGRCPLCTRQYCSRECQVKDWALHKRMCAASGSDRSDQPTVSTSRSTAQVINAVTSTSVALATHDDAARSGVVVCNPRTTIVPTVATLRPVRATAAMVVDLPPKAGVTSTSATVATRKSQIGAQAEPSENKLVLSCCCHVSESGEGHHFHGVSVCGIRINLEQASAISITEYRFPATTIPALQKQCAEVLDTIFGLARNTDTPTTIAAQLLEKYIELKRMSNTMELMHAREVDSTLDGVMNIIKECRICHLGNPCWELLQYYVNIFLGERIRYDREFRDRLRVRVSDTEQILAAFCHKPMADELCARMSTDIAKLKVFLTMWNPSRSHQVTSTPTAAEAEMQAIMTTVAQVECNTAAVQISLAKSMKAIEHGGDDNSEIISRRSEIIKMESELAEKFEKRIGDWVDLQYAELQKADGDAMLLIALCFATKALMARAMLLRGHKHPPVPSSAVSDVAERTTLKLKRCADDFADARAHYAAGEYAESIEGFDRCTKMLPSFYTCWYLLGNARRATGGDYGYRQSVNAYRMVLHGSSQNATVHCSLGASLGQVGMWAEAIKSYDDAISLDPSCGVYQRRRSYAQRKLKSTNDARQGLSVGSTSIGASKQHASQSSEKRMLAGQPQSEPTFLADAQVTEIFIGGPAPTAHRKRKRKKGSGVVGRPPKAKRETTVVQSAPHLSDTVLPEIHVELEVEEHKGSKDSPGMLPSSMEVSEGGHPKRSEGPGRPSSYPLEQPEGPPAEEVDEEVDGLLFFSSKV